MKQLFLEDLANKNESEVLDHIASTFETERPVDIELLIAYESVGSWGCDSSNWFLFRKNGKLYENHGSHCSCYGFEGQWKPEETTIEYLKSDKFYVSTGGYDKDEEGNKQKVKDYLQQL